MWISKAEWVALFSAPNTKMQRAIRGKLVFALRLFVCVYLLISTTAQSQSSPLENGDTYCIFTDSSIWFLPEEKLCGNEDRVTLPGAFDEDVTGIIVADGYELVAFDEKVFDGRSKVHTGLTDPLSRRDQDIRSFYLNRTDVIQQRVCLYERKDYRGDSFCVGEIEIDDLESWEDELSSARVPVGYRLKLFSRTDFRGDSIELTSDSPQFQSLNNKADSLIIYNDDLDGDEDSDGVINHFDRCPDTPVAENADEQGCSISQLDDDNDGINDGADVCPDTPGGEEVNTEGCSLSQLDTDNDGISDLIDACPATPEDETVNAEGCSLSQLDTDGDGMNDALDECPGTPEGESVNETGCSLSQIDTDGDGVSDAVDQCPATPVEETANTDGCSPSQLDTDNDGVNDALDVCPATPQGEDVDSGGCALSQLDTDNDGVSDALDRCPATQSGEAVDQNGCAANQLDSDNDGIVDHLDSYPFQNDTQCEAE